MGATKQNTLTPILARRLGVAVRRLRNQAGISQDELAHRCNLHRAYMGVIERGEQNITVQKLVQVCEGLGVKPSRVLGELGL